MALPPFDTNDAERIARQLYDLRIAARDLPGELDRNFLLTPLAGDPLILKIASQDRLQTDLDLENRAMAHLGERGVEVPQAIPGKNEATIVRFQEGDGKTYFIRVLTYLPGVPYGVSEVLPRDFLRSLGVFTAWLDRVLQDFEHPAMHRQLPFWDLTRANETLRTARDPNRSGQAAKLRRGESKDIAPLNALINPVLHRFETIVKPVLGSLPAQVIHNDINDHNLLVEEDTISGLLDFGDMLHNPRVCELAIAAAYALLGRDDPLAAAARVIGGYHEVNPLTEAEIGVLFDLICARLAVSLAVAARRKLSEPEHAYLQVSAEPAERTLKALVLVDPELAHYHFRAACGLDPLPNRAALTAWLQSCPEDLADLADAIVEPPVMGEIELRTLRSRSLSANLSLSYQNPLHIVRGRGQYLYDAEGREYLDCVNNVCQVGHSHPRVVGALAAQAARLNTNTRYLHENILRLAERLTDTLPDPLEVCFFVNSGSEANDLALRLARAYTGKTDMLVLEGGYHGNLGALVDLSPYKHAGPGGMGAPEWVHPLPMPCAYRGVHREAADPGALYAEDAEGAILELEGAGRGLAGFLGEAIMGTGGQVVFPEGTLRQIYERVRGAGGVCIADEVQIGFGRVGTHYWGFETQGVIPDIVTVGKPFGNGHPLGAVVTTRAIASAFDNGMEYFNTFGGNPVSCAVGLAVMDVIDEEGLQAHALDVGALLKLSLEAMQAAHPLFGDVRGSGLFLGIELVRNRETLEPAAKEAAGIVERLKERGVLLSVDGLLHNVIKIKPPLPFSQADAKRLVRELEEALSAV